MYARVKTRACHGKRVVLESVLLSKNIYRSCSSATAWEACRSPSSRRNGHTSPTTRASTSACLAKGSGRNQLRGKKSKIKQKNCGFFFTFILSSDRANWIDDVLELFGRDAVVVGWTFGDARQPNGAPHQSHATCAGQQQWRQVFWTSLGDRRTARVTTVQLSFVPR